MKILRLFFAAIIASAMLLIVPAARAQDTTDTGPPASEAGWVIDKFDSSIAISQSGKIDVTETISVDFDSLQKHGIYRYIPIKYRDDVGNAFKLRLKFESVKNKSGQSAPYEISGNNIKTIKIGDPDKTITGKQTYIINYTVDRAIRYLDTDELYWNATGTDWPVPIKSAQVSVSFSSGTDNVKTKCFTDVMGSTDQNCIASAQNNVVQFSAQNLAPGEGLTIIAGAPAGTINKPSRALSITYLITDNLSYLILLITLPMFLIIWWRRGRDPRINKSIAPEFAPPQNLSPSMMGVLKDERADMLDISVAIIQLASRGFIKIREVEKKKLIGKGVEYEIERQGSKVPDNDFDKELLGALFESGDKVKILELKNKFYKHIPTLKDLLYKEAMERKFFVQNPNLTRGLWLTTGLLIPGGLMFLLAWISGSFVSALIGAIVLTPFAIWFGLSMPKKTPEGAEALRLTRGFRLFIYTAERYRARFEEDKNIFSKYLPYAMVFDLTHKWAKAFEGLKIEPPDWYVGYHPFTAIVFADAITNASTSLNSAMTTAPSSSGSSGFGGGGFSGGGFGGGGGGSW